jgi:proline dehydrogenase
MRSAIAVRAARRYVAGPELRDALTVATALRDQGLACTIGYWNAPDEPPDQVRRHAAAAAAALASGTWDAYLSLKAPALGWDLTGLLTPGAPLHLDALGPATADGHLELARSLRLGVTLPGRWRRSPLDAAALAGLRVRVVKGQFPDPGRELPPRTGFLDVVDALAGHAAFVAVATHDGPLAMEAVGRLRAAGTPCGLELLQGLPVPHCAWELEVPVRVYVPYGRGYLPYAARRLLTHPRTAVWLARDLLSARPRRPSRGAPSSAR